jgi:hypothetical protein
MYKKMIGYISLFVVCILSLIILTIITSETANATGGGKIYPYCYTLEEHDCNYTTECRNEAWQKGTTQGLSQRDTIKEQKGCIGNRTPDEKCKETDDICGERRYYLEANCVEPPVLSDFIYGGSTCKTPIPTPTQ